MSRSSFRTGDRNDVSGRIPVAEQQVETFSGKLVEDGMWRGGTAFSQVCPSPCAYCRQRRGIDQETVWRVAETLEFVSPIRDVHVGVVVDEMTAPMGGRGVETASRQGVFRQGPTIPGTCKKPVVAGDAA